MRVSFNKITALTTAALLSVSLTSSVHAAAEIVPVTPEEINATTLSGSFLAARIATFDRNSEAAVAYYRRALALDSENKNLLQNAFMTLIANGDFKDGVKIAEKIVNIPGGPPIARIVLVVDSIRSKDMNTAQQHLDQIKNSDLDRLLAGLIQAWIQSESGDGKTALATLSALNGPNWFNLFLQYHGGLIAMANGNTSEALARLGQAVANRTGGAAANETYMRAVAALIDVQLGANDPESAQKTLALGLRAQPANPVLHAKKNAVDEGKPQTAKPMSIQRGVAEVFYNLGSAINSEGGQQFALIYLHLAQALAPDDDAVVLSLADLFDKQKLYKRANSLFAKVPESSPYRRIAQLEMALNLDTLGKLDQAREHLDNLVVSDPDDMITYLSYGGMLARHELYADAAKIYESAVSRIANPQRFHWNLMYRLGIAYERTKQWPKAEASFKRALKLFPNQPNVLNYLGYSWVDMGINLDDGLKMIRKAVELRPNDGYIVDSLGWVYYRLGRFEEAVKELERAVELRAADPTINDHLGDAYWRVGRKLEATFQWSHAIDLKPVDDSLQKIEAKLENGLPAEDKTEMAQPKKKTPENGG